MGELNLKSLKLEGQLYKYTNVVKGFQIRYFVVNTQTSKLDYYMSEDAKLQRPRGSIELLSSIVSPSEEDSTTFTINTPENEIFKLRAQDAKERQLWVNALRLVAQATNEIDSNLSSKLESKASLVEKTELALNHQNYSVTNIELVNEVFNHVILSHKKLENLINELPSRNSKLCKYDKDMLILKSTAASCVNNLVDCCNTLNSYQKKLSNQNENDFLIPSQINFNVTGKKSDFSSQTSPKYKQINHDEELTDDEPDIKNLNEKNAEYVQLFEDNKNQILHVLPNLKNGMDLSKISLPTFILDQRSLLEMFADFMSHPDLFIKIPDEKTAEERFLSVIDWFLSLFHQIRKESLVKKPYNPILGETFNCSWKIKNPTDQPDDKPSCLISYAAEQVSHHPAITAFFVECKQKRMKLNASLKTKSKYQDMSISVQLIGELILKLEKFSEEYHLTLPNWYARSIVTKPWIELGDACTITCAQTGFKATIEFQIKPSSQVYAEVRNKNEELICKVKGEWNGQLEYEYLNDPLKRNKLVDLLGLKVIKKRVRPIDLQDENESRRVWCHVTQALKKPDIDAATNFKNLIEKQQRTCDKLRKEKHLEFVPKNFFKKKSNSESLISVLNTNDGNSETSNGNYWIHKNWSS